MKYPEKVRQDYLLEKFSTAIEYRPKSRVELKRLLAIDHYRRDDEARSISSFQEELERGVEEEKKEDIQRIYLKGNFSPEEIADLLEVSLEFVNGAIIELR